MNRSFASHRREVHPNESAESSDAAFARAVAPHLDRCVRLAHGFLGDPDLAWDAVQESLLALWRSETWPLDLGAWLHRAVVHRSLQALRARRRRDHNEQRCATASPALAEDPHRAFERAESSVRLRTALGALPTQYGAALELRMLEGRDYGSIADLLGVPIGTVRSRIHRGSALLRRRLGTREGDR